MYNNITKENMLFTLVILFITLFYSVYIFQGGGYLADDNQFWNFISLEEYFRDPNIYARPLAACYKAFLSLFSFNKSMLILIVCIFNVIQYVLYYRLIKLILNSKLIALLMVWYSFVFIYSTSTMFSATMIVSSIPISMFFGACLLLRNKNLLGYLLSSVLILLSLMCYEISLAVLPLVVFLFYKTNDGYRDLFLRIFFVLILPVTIVFLYKNFIGSYLFDNYVSYTDSKINISLQNIVDTSIAIFKTYFLDTIFLCKRGIQNIKFFSLFDFTLVLISVLINGLIYLIKDKLEWLLNKRIFIFSVLFLIFSHLIFYLSVYSPNVYGFENRTLGLVRFCFGLNLVLVLIYLLNKFKKVKIITISFFIIYSFFSSIVLVAQKNAWIEASQYNEKVMNSFVSVLPNRLESKYFYVAYNSSVDFKHMTDERTLKSNYEFDSYLKKNNLDSLDLQLNSYRLKDENLDSLFGVNFNKRYKTTLKFDYNGELIHNDFSLPIYIYNYNENRLYLIRNELDYNNFLKY